jgi:hypothetical protein
VFDLNKETGYASKPFLVFRALKENIHVRVTIDTFTWAKNKDNSRMGNIWTLVLTIYDDYTDTDNPFAIDFIKQQLGNFNRALETLNGKLFLISRVLPNLADQIASPLNQTIKQLNSTISGTRAVVNSPAQAISILKTVVNNVMNTLGNVVDFFNFESGDSFVANDWSTAIFTDGWYGANRLADSTSNFASAYSGLFDSNDAQSIPKDIDLGTSSSALREEALVLEELMYAINIAKGYLNLTKSVLNTAEIGSTGFLNRDERSWGALSALFSTEDNVPKNVKSNLKGISYTLRSGENLLNIAEKLTGSRDGWVVLSEINDCKDAYTRNDGSPLGAGSTILVPVQDNSLAISLLPNTGDDLGSKIGTDFMLDQNGDFVLDGDDLKLVSGVSNLKQAVRNRLQTKKGELVHTPNLGLDEILGNKNLWSISYIAMHIREQLLQDGRFIDIKDIQIEEQADELYVSITAQTIEKKNLTFKTGV